MNSWLFKVLEMSDSTQGTGDMDSDNSSTSRSELESFLAFIMVLRLDKWFIYPSSSVKAFSFSSKSRQWGFQSGVFAVNSRWRHLLYSLGVGLWVGKYEIVPLKTPLELRNCRCWWSAMCACCHLGSPRATWGTNWRQHHSFCIDYRRGGCLEAQVCRVLDLK